MQRRVVMNEFGEVQVIKIVDWVAWVEGSLAIGIGESDLLLKYLYTSKKQYSTEQYLLFFTILNFGNFLVWNISTWEKKIYMIILFVSCSLILLGKSLPVCLIHIASQSHIMKLIKIWIFQSLLAFVPGHIFSISL